MNSPGTSQQIDTAPGLFHKLPSEILLLIAYHLADLDALRFAQTDRRRYELLIPQVYVINVRYHRSDALLWGATTGSVDTVNLALAAGANVNSLITKTWDREYREKLEQAKNAPGQMLVPSLRQYANMPLCEAAKNGHIDVLEALLAAGARLTDEKPKRRHAVRQPQPALFAAAESGNLQVLELLLAVDEADINVKDSRGDGLLLAAVRSGSMVMIEYLLRSLKDPDTSPDCATPVLTHAIVHKPPNILRTLLDSGLFDVNKRWPPSGTNVILYAARRHPEHVFMLLKRPEVDVAAFDAHGQTVVGEALWSWDQEDVDALLSHPRIEFDAFALFEEACLRSSSGNMKGNLIGSEHATKAPCSSTGRTWMHLAAESEYHDQTLIQRLHELDKTMLNAQCNRGNTPLAVAAAMPDTLLNVEALLSLHPDLELANENGETPLHLACRDSDLCKIQAIVKKGANLHVTSNLSLTPLQVAAKLTDASADIISFLMEAEASSHPIP